MVILQNGHGFVAGVVAGRMNALLIRHATKPMMTKLSTALPKSPILNGIGPGVTADCHRFGAGVVAATIGMMKSSTTAVTSLLRAPPTTTAMASARTFSLSKNALKSLHMDMACLVKYGKRWTCGHGAEPFGSRAPEVSPARPGGP